ncbi:glycosyltransferase family 4 protein [Serratia liquefaciens]|uniref:glycosyltransferase family 4 protein n=1 Tax=Serratia liquefaciens TaxID=614 RepID=UPI000412D40A|nr:glycosyltransferase family 4 protein [Serratia liquefaciens]MDU4172363.1 glycosyltransferase family 4 protein [Serratia liquefaciens]CAI0912541.1 GDP-mannose-dependent alpha-(1-6)-phosphatidylinositol monomannoside mannosyltransferase [Serratia liquefaciens]CAI2119799.1 GDP-mannose-dependent alpha-(1-6)-phosphatidylinositol monomannoside mannosyltransferase [Serratia liquefaciens]CAI2473056.1 GDP-mannose-dependent alpha-(1-6)-phosphatidylinositol monomannoside mannosyltransferase [Serratia l
MKNNQILGVICNNRMLSDTSGNYWVSKQTYGDNFWKRYLTIFSVVRPICRVTLVDNIPDGWVRITLDNVKPIPIPDFQGVGQLLKIFSKLRKELLSAIGLVDKIIIRGPTILSSVIQDKFLVPKTAYGIEVVSDPWDDFAKGSYNHKLRIFLQQFFYLTFKMLVKNAYVISYVTSNYLQKKYPAKNAEFSTNYSSISLTSSDIIDSGITCFPRSDVWHIGLIARLDTPHKGGDILLKSIKKCLDVGANVKCTIVGDGIELAVLKRLTQQLGIQKHVMFPGAVSTKDEVFAYLDSFDIFVLPTRQEGLPRSVIEAMARGLPCLSTPIGGVPEIVNENELFKLDDLDELAMKIMNLMDNPDYCTRLSQENLHKSKCFEEAELESRRNKLYSILLAAPM